MSFLAGELEDAGYRRKQQHHHVNEVIRDVHDLHDRGDLPMPSENLSYLKKVQEMYSMFQPHGHQVRAPSPELQPSLLPHINSATPPPTSSLPPLQPQQPNNALHDKLLKPRLSVSAPNRFLQRSKSKSASNLFDRDAIEGTSFHTPRLSPQNSPASSTKLPPAIPYMAATTLAPHNSPPLSPGPSPGPSPHLVPSSCLPAPSATPSHPILLVPHHAYQHPSIPDATQPLASGASTTPASAPDDKPAADLGPRVGSKSRSGSRKGSRRPSSEGSHFKAGRVQPEVTSRYQKRGCCDKMGMHYDFGRDYVPGRLPEIGPDQDVPNLPARSGTGTWLRPARVGSSSCVPPPEPEPLLPPPASLCDMMTMHDQMRELQPEAVINRIIYDCVLPPVSIHAQGQAADANDKQGASMAGFPSVVAGDTFLDLSPSNLDNDCLNMLNSPSPPPFPPTQDSTCSTGTPYATQFNYFPDLPCWYSPTGPEDRTLVFESRFEGGNLRRAIQVYPNEYDLVLRPDVNTKRHTQWFYFAISNTRKGQRYKFNIINLMKEGSLYCEGMLPLIHSEVMSSASKQQEQQQQGEEVPASSPRGTSSSSRFTSWPDMSSSSNMRPSSRGSQASSSSRLEDSERPSRSSAQSRAGLNFEELQRQAGEEREQQEAADEGRDSRTDHQQQSCSRQEHHQRVDASQDCQEGGFAGWHRGGEQVCYYRNTIKRNGRGGGKRYFTLSFAYTAQHDNDVIHFAHCFPFTYTDLQVYLKALECHPQRSPFVQRSLLTTTLAGNAVDCLTITAPPSASDPTKKKKGAVITARVHPGESNSSWMVRGLIEYLTGSSAEACMLRKHFVFKIVPMLNPDGVVVGNYRCNLAGFDLNRTWADASRKLHPTIFACKAMLKQFLEERQVVLFSDFHGHSRKPNIFSYGCGKKPSGGKDWAPVWPGFPVPGSVGGLQDVPVRFQGRLLPLLMQYSAPDLFSYQHCTVKVQKSKAGTSRVVVFREMGLTNSFTLEASIAGPNMGRQAGHHFSTKDLELMGAALASALADYWDPLSYGIPELISELDALHAVNGDLEQTQPDAEDSTDSDDEPSSDDAEAMADTRGQKQGKGTRVRRGPTKSQLRMLSREYAERAAAGLMDVLNSCTAQQQRQQQQLLLPLQQEQLQQLQPPHHKRHPIVTFANGIVASAQPQQAAQVLYPPVPLLADELQEVGPPPLLPHLQGCLHPTASQHQHQHHLPAPGKPSLPSPLQGPAMPLRPTPRDPAHPQIQHPIQQAQHQQQQQHALQQHTYLLQQQHYQQQQQHLQALRAQADIEHFRSMEHLRTRGIYRGDTISWANAPGRLSSTNVSLNIQQAEREREAARQRESLEGWDSILGIRTELSDKQAGC